MSGEPGEGKLCDPIGVTGEGVLPDGLRIGAFRDGMLAYEFVPQPDLSFRDWRAVRVQIINAHLACLTASNGEDTYMAAATGDTVAPVIFESGDIINTWGHLGVMLLSLARARQESSTEVGDWRFIRTSPTVTASELMWSYHLLSQLLGSPHRKETLLYAELLVRAQAALSVYDNGGALVYAWTAAEGMLRSMFARWIDECAESQNAGVDDQGNARDFLDSSRRRGLLQGGMTSWHMAETLSLVGRLPYGLYRTIRTCEAARNKWLHNQDLNSLQHAPSAISSAQELLNLAEGIDLRSRPPTLDGHG